MTCSDSREIRIGFWFTSTLMVDQQARMKGMLRHLLQTILPKRAGSDERFGTCYSIAGPPSEECVMFCKDGCNILAGDKGWFVGIDAKSKKIWVEASTSSWEIVWIAAFPENELLDPEKIDFEPGSPVNPRPYRKPKQNPPE